MCCTRNKDDLELRYIKDWVIWGTFEVHQKWRGVVYLSKYATYWHEIKQKDETCYEGSFWWTAVTIGITWLIKVWNFDIIL